MAVTAQEVPFSDGRRFAMWLDNEKEVGSLVHEEGELWTLDLGEHGTHNIYGATGPPIASAIGYTAMAFGREVA